MNVVDVTESATSSELGPKVVYANRKVREEIPSVCSLHCVDLQELMDEHKHTSGEALLVSVDLIPTDPPYNVRNRREVTSSHYDVFFFDGTANKVRFFKQVKRPSGRSRLFCFAIHFGQLYMMLFRERQTEKSDGDDVTGRAAQHGWMKQKAVFKVRSASLHCTSEEKNKMVRNVG